MRRTVILICFACLFAGSCAKQSTKDDVFESSFVTLTDAVPDAILEIRYYGTYNFVGARIDGYLQPTALLTKEAAAALKQVSDYVMAKGYRLKIYKERFYYQHISFMKWALPSISYYCKF